MLGSFPFKLGFQNHILARGSMSWLGGRIRRTHINRVTSFLGDVGDRTQRARGKHNLVAIDERVFINAAEYVSPGDMVSNLEIEGGEIPLV